MQLSIWRKTFWTFYWIALRRSFKDRRALRAAFGVSLILLAAVSWLVISIPFLPLGLLLGLGFVPALLLKRLLLPGDFVRRPGAKIPVEVHCYLEERAGILASLLARGGSEIYLQHAQLPAGAQVITRQVQNTFLRESGLWQKLERTEVDLVSAPDGAWTPEQRGEVTNWSEQLRLLRWALGKDAELKPLAHFPQVDFLLAKDLLARRKFWRRRKPLRSVSELQAERNIALQYMARVIAEMNGRGMLAVEGDAWRQIRDESAGPSRDYLVGTQTVGDLSSDSLSYLGAITAARERYASWLVDQLKSNHIMPFSEWTRAAEVRA